MNSKCLINAIESRNQTMIQKVLKEGKKKWDPNTDWDEILYYSIKMGEKKLIEKIISLGARDYNMALSSACEILIWSSFLFQRVRMIGTMLFFLLVNLEIWS